MEPIYAHQLEENELRLLEILPKEPGNEDLIKCKLHYKTYEAQPEFTALSYAWGDVKDTVEIEVDGKLMQITTNLMTALKEIRSSMHEKLTEKEREVDQLDCSTLWWIDAICLNQSDDIEKRRQVRHMDNVYKQAKTVLLWLGEEDIYTDTAIKEIERVSNRIENSPILSTFCRNATWVETQAEYIALTDLMQNHLIPEWDRWSLVGSLLERPWFTRLWVIQEAALAKYAVAACGHHRVPWHHFKGIFKVLSQFMLSKVAQYGNLPKSSIWREEARNFISHYAARGVVHFEAGRWKTDLTGTTLHIAFVSVSWGEFIASDPRDQIYGLLSLISDAERDKITVRYDKKWTARQLYGQVTAITLNSGADLSLLRFCSGVAKSKAADMPSWALDWRDRRQTLVSGDIEFVASHNWRRGSEIYHFDSDLCELRLPCIIVDSIKSMQPARPIYHWHEQDSKKAKKLQRWVRLLRKAFAKSKLLAGSSHRLDSAVVRVCTLGHAYQDDMIPAYKSFMGDQARLDRVIRPSRWLENSFNFLFTCQATENQAFISKEGYVGLARQETQAGDLIILLPEAETPFIIRASGQDGKYQLVGNAYVDGIMNGEYLDNNKDAKQIKVVLV